MRKARRKGEPLGDLNGTYLLESRRTDRAGSIQGDFVKWDLAFAKIQGEIQSSRIGGRSGGCLILNEIVIQIERFEDLFDLRGVIRQGLDEHDRTAFATDKRIDFPHLRDEFCVLPQIAKRDGGHFFVGMDTGE